MSKNVALFIPALPFGGAERVVQRLSSILGDTYNLFIIVFDGSIMKYKCACEIIDMNIPSNKSKFKKIIAIFSRTKKFNRIVAENNIDAVISFLDGANMINLLSNTKHKKIISVRNYKASEKNLSMMTKISDFLLSKLYNRTHGVVSVSRIIAQNLENDYGVDSNKIKVIYNPYDINEITNLAMEKLESQHIDFYNNSKVIISVGRKMHQKGFWHLIKSFSLIKQHIKNARLVIIGDGEQDDLIKGLIQELKLEGEVLLTGHQSNPFKFISKSDVYVMTSLFEGFPNSLVEAMACRKPIVSTDCKSGPREILYQESNIDRIAHQIEFADYGVLVPPLTEKENWDSNSIEDCEVVLSQAVVEILENAKAREEYSIRAFERAHEFDYQRCKKAFIEIID
ncbi:glycosyltransferase [Paenibacillus lycopersici]|uniref:Glycosyltransferase n=1 Tax=Paenibacillus lycopersici TaxID=2704462 RepID=A0A6C0FSU1_9BACL|nr:glycosyltransferase [Paenibacillus lycopersici]QHT59917.1 glycosyltransferase [Paenibacillus lycopersici]